MEFIRNIQFADPWFLLLLLLLPVYVIAKKRDLLPHQVTMRASSMGGIGDKPTGRARWIFLLPLFRAIAFCLLVLSLARPQTGFSKRSMYAEGIDIMLSLDVSPSMYAIDFKPNRMEAAKVAAMEFIDNRVNDRIGLVVFAGEAFTQCPATLDHPMLKEQVATADNWYLKDGTAIGDGLFMAINRLADTTLKTSKVIILLTDGVRVGGKFSPLDAAQAAKQLNIRIYTIGVGARSDVPIPVVDKNGRRIFELDPRISYDAPMMQKVAEMTGGKFFEAPDSEKLKEVYTEIDAIEKQKISVDITERYDEHYFYLLIAALSLLVLEFILSKTLLRTLT